MAVDAGTLLQPATVETLQTPQHLRSGGDTGYGLGWDVEPVSLAGDTTREVGHESEFIIGGSGALVMLRSRGIVVALTTNTSFAKMSPLARKLAEAFAGPGTAPAPKQ